MIFSEEEFKEKINHFFTQIYEKMEFIFNTGEDINKITNKTTNKSSSSSSTFHNQIHNLTTIIKNESLSITSIKEAFNYIKY